MVDRIASLPNGNPEKNQLGKFFQAQVCDKKHSSYVWCCKDGKPKTNPGKVLTNL